MMPNSRRSKEQKIPDYFYENLFSNSLAQMHEARVAFEQADDKARLIRSVLESRESIQGLPPVATGILLHLLRHDSESVGFEKLRTLVLDEARQLRAKLFGNEVAMMVPIEISSYCASNCSFCGWRSDNKEMVRLKISEKAIQKQLEFLTKYDFSHFEIVAGDDLSFIKNDLAQVVRTVKQQAVKINPTARVSICLTPLLETHYQDLKAEGLDTVLTWQETYSSKLYERLITAGPKAHGITQDFKVAKDQIGCAVRMHSHELAVRAGLQVGLGVMLGLEEEHPEADILSAISHGKKLIEHYNENIHPIIIGMPTWNPITTAKTDNSRFHRTKISPERDFELIAAVYLLSFPDRLAWVFPNCRVSKATQISSIKTAGCFTSGMVRVGPGAYLEYSAKEDIQEGFSKSSEPLAGLTKARILNGEQFTHHFDTQENYIKKFRESGIEIVQETKFLSELAQERVRRSQRKVA